MESLLASSSKIHALSCSIEIGRNNSDMITDLPSSRMEQLQKVH